MEVLKLAYISADRIKKIKKNVNWRMLIDFNKTKEITVPGMNNGTGVMTSTMFYRGLAKRFVMAERNC